MVSVSPPARLVMEVTLSVAPEPDSTRNALPAEVTAATVSPPLPTRAVADARATVPRFMVPTLVIVPAMVRLDCVRAVMEPPRARVLPAVALSASVPVFRKATSLLTEPPPDRSRL